MLEKVVGASRSFLYAFTDMVLGVQLAIHAYPTFDRSVKNPKKHDGLETSNLNDLALSIGNKVAIIPAVYAGISVVEFYINSATESRGLALVPLATQAASLVYEEVMRPYRQNRNERSQKILED